MEITYGCLALLMIGAIHVILQVLPNVLTIVKGVKKRRVGFGITLVVISASLWYLWHPLGFVVAWVGFGAMCAFKENKRNGK